MSLFIVKQNWIKLFFCFIVIYVVFKRSSKEISLKLLWIYIAYLALGQIVHPWYLTILIPFAILSRRIYPIIWAFLSFYCYSAFKANGSVELSNFILFSEYCIFAVLLYLEEFKKVNLFEKISNFSDRLIDSKV